METTVITAHIPAELSRRVDKIVQKIDRSKGWVVKQALSNWIADEEEKYELTLKAMKDVREGKTIPNSEVQAWLRDINAAS